nr:hypothetical protein Iba_chr05dCG8960 [Ipomoea batatas]GMC99704.1 hypothetical protein Iba_chr05eCG8230 [Ipomoea batatas]
MNPLNFTIVIVIASKRRSKHYRESSGAEVNTERFEFVDKRVSIVLDVCPSATLETNWTLFISRFLR